MDLVDKLLQNAKTWTERFGPTNTISELTKTTRTVWASSFSTFLQLDDREKGLVSNISVVYKRPPALLNILTNYRKIAHQEDNFNTGTGSSKPCNKCALCGTFGEYVGKSMVDPVSFIKTAQGKVFHLHQNLTCCNYGIYAAQCGLCKQIYVGQSKNRFSSRWTGHRTIWKNKNCLNQRSDRASLIIHYQTKHNANINSLPEIHNCFKVIFLQEPREVTKLDIAESRWINKLNAQININRTVLPKYL